MKSFISIVVVAFTFVNFLFNFVKQAIAFTLCRINDVLEWELAHNANTTFRLQKAYKAVDCVFVVGRNDYRDKTTTIVYSLFNGF